MGDYKWIGLIRKFYNCSFYNDSNAVQMFLHIFLNAQREDKPYFDQITMRGQFRTSIKDIMQFLEISRKSARRSLDKLKAAGVIHVVSLRRNGVIITVRDFSKFLALENIRGGWVKLYYDLDYQDFFVNAQVLHVYLHILLHTYSENENYEDPFWFDLKKISTSTGISAVNIKDCLLKLRKLGILNVGYNNQKRLSSVRLIEFSDYIKDTYPVASVGSSVGYAASIEDTAGFDKSFSDVAPMKGSEEGDTKTEQKGLKEGPKDMQKPTSQNRHEVSTNTFVNNANTVSYDTDGQKEDQKKEQRSPNVEAAKTSPNVQQGSYAREHISKENRDKRIESIHYDNYSPSQNFSSIEELVFDDEWVCSMQQLYGFADKGTLYNALTLFLANLKCRKEEVPGDLNKFLDYFCNWYKRNEKRLQSKLKAQIPPKDYAKVLWGKCMSAFAKIVGERAFVSVFQQLSFDSFDNAAKRLTLCVPNSRIYHTLEENYIDTLCIVLHKFFGVGLSLQYRIVNS